MLTRFNTKQGWALVLLLVGISFQLLVWVHTQGALEFKTGDDEGPYTFLAYEMMGEIDSTPVFDFRPPGWPATLAVLLSLAGVENYWVLGLLDRLLLGLFPVLYFLILSKNQEKHFAFAALLSLVSLVLPVQRIGPLLPMTEVFYTFLQVLALFLISQLDLGRKGISRWMIAALSLLLLYRVSIRLQGVLVYAGVVGLIGLFYYLRQRNFRKVLSLAGIMLLPLVVGTLLLGLYNKQQTGSFGFPLLGSPPPGFFLERTVDAAELEVPQSEEMDQLRELLPEVPDDRMPLNIWPLQFLVLYRAEVLQDAKRFEFYADVISPATSQYLVANMDEFLRFGLRWLVHDIFPKPFTPITYPKLEFDASMPTPAHRIESRFGTRVSREMLEAYDGLIERSKFQAFSDEEAISIPLVDLYLERKDWPIQPGIVYSGLAGVISMLLLVLVFRRPQLGLGIMVFYFGDIIPAALLCGGCVAIARFQYPLQSASLLALLLVIGHLEKAIRRRRLVEEKGDRN